MRQKIDFGIDLGTTNSAIAMMEDGEPNIIKSDEGQQMDTTPSCVLFNRKKTMFIGLSAKQGITRDAVRNFKQRKSTPPNGYQEFKRNMGTDYQYVSENMDKQYSPEQLSAEVLKKLTGYVRDENINAAVITVPAMFEQRQLDATQRAAELAGFGYCELLQEPIAASIAYGIKPDSTDGYWLVFDFGGGTFDAALMHIDEGIMKVVDSEGDNHLGGKDLDNAITDHLLIPQLLEQYELTDTVSTPEGRKLLQEALKHYAEEAKIALSTKTKWDGFIEDLGEDDDGEDIEAGIEISLDQYEAVVSPIFQKAIDVSLKLIKRNNLSSSDLNSFVLVGGPTFQQTLRRMLQEQITENIDTSIDPMTAVAKGATLFASTKDIPRDLQKRDMSKAQLTLKYPETTVETAEHLGLRIDREGSTTDLPATFTLEVIRGDGAWSSGRLTVENDVELLELQLNTGKTNHFQIKLFTPEGNAIACEPSSLTIIQGVKIASATLPLSIGLEIYDTFSTKQGVWPLSGLEKNKTLPAKGKSTFKTMQDIRPGIQEDVISIPIYEMKYGKEGSKALLNSIFGEFRITGADLPSFLPKGSDIEITLNIDASRRGKLSVYIPAVDESFDIEIKSEISTDTPTATLKREINQARTTARGLASTGNRDAEGKLQELDKAEKLLDERGEDRDTKEKVSSQLKETLIELENYEEQDAWPKAELALENALESLREINEQNGNARTRNIFYDFESQTRQIVAKQDIVGAKKLEEDIGSLKFSIMTEDISFWIGFIVYMDEEFNNIDWTDESAAFSGIQQLKRLLQTDPSKDQLEDAVISVARLMTPESRAEMENVDTSLLRR
ncbi:Hsp70 family protein [Psychrobacter okhotskensis]|uniref:Hsp70 family protein n=1 Tax=Psychrobacter okhotskensis TaxID=212403 RepID=UPI001566B3F5|nr:Hsp70 family protein [Psychrobacter okhotskensis]NRD70587.1 Hsp70 family protein [Psychrobacter okhotskensis]